MIQVHFAEFELEWHGLETLAWSIGVLSNERI
jgi:hypothetical protein